MRRAYGPSGGGFVDRSANNDYDFRRNALLLANDAAVSRSLLVFAAAEFPERIFP